MKLHDQWSVYATCNPLPFHSVTDCKWSRTNCKVTYIMNTMKCHTHIHISTCTCTCTHTQHTVLWLSGFCPEQPGWAGTRRNIHPLTPIVVINRPCFLHLLQSMASSLFNPHTWQYFSTISLQVFFGLLLGQALPLHIPYITSPIIFFLQHTPIPLYSTPLHLQGGLLSHSAKAK